MTDEISRGDDGHDEKAIPDGPSGFEDKLQALLAIEISKKIDESGKNPSIIDKLTGQAVSLTAFITAHASLALVSAENEELFVLQSLTSPQYFYICYLLRYSHIYLLLLSPSSGANLS